MNEDQGQEIFKVEQEKVSAVGKMDMSGAFGASSINVEKVQGAENFGKTVVRLIKYMRPELVALILMMVISARLKASYCNFRHTLKPATS